RKKAPHRSFIKSNLQEYYKVNIFKSSKFVSRSLIGAVGLSASAMAFLGVPEVAKAADIWRGSDYLHTIMPTSLDFQGAGGVGVVDFKSLPIGPGNTDTIVQRQEDCIFGGLGGSCTIPIEMVELSLMSVAPVEVNNIFYDVFVTEGPNSTGTMTINHEFPDNGTPEPEGTFTSILNVFFEAKFVDVNDPNNMFSVFSEDIFGGPKVFEAFGEWSHEPVPGSVIVQGAPGTVVGDNTADQDANCHSQGPGCLVGQDSEGNPVGDFFIVGQVIHETPQGDTHTVDPAKTPEPSTVMMSSHYNVSF
ncbi:MAG: hypothetical protein F6K24_58325, partial [Okeania sp. SIO2D1]|nr:hypothetical protein [Okeania sp. SIO2D1]